MAFGKGTWKNQNKILPGTYINFVGEEQILDKFGVRGKAAMALSLDWGPKDLIKLTPAMFRDRSKALFGYEFTDPKVQPIYEVFIGGARELYLFNLNEASVKATNDIATAKYGGIRGNELAINVTANVDTPSKFDVVTTLAGIIVDKQKAVTNETVKDNDFVTFTESPVLSVKTFTFSGGENGAAAKKANHTKFLGLLESYEINAVGLFEATASDGDCTSLYANWAIDQRDVLSNTVQVVLAKSPSDHEAVINIDETVNLVPWVLGAEAGCELNATVQNKVYNGSYALTKTYTQIELEDTIAQGKLVFHKVGDEYRVLEDINSMITVPEGKNPEFRYNQTIRVIDQIAIDVSKIFNYGYIGKVANDEAGRISFKNQVVMLLNDYVNRSVIAPYNTDNVVCVEGEQRGSLVITMPVTLLDMLEKAYVTVVVG